MDLTFCYLFLQYFLRFGLNCVFVVVSDDDVVCDVVMLSVPTKKRVDVIQMVTTYYDKLVRSRVPYFGTNYENKQ